MRIALIVLFCCSCAWSADEASDEADFAAYKSAQEVAQQEAQDLTRRDATVKQIEADISSLKFRYKGKTVEEALSLWRVDIRNNADQVQRFSSYAWMRRIEEAAKKLKARTGAATIESAVASEKADIQAKR